MTGENWLMVGAFVALGILIILWFKTKPKKKNGKK